MEPGQLIADLCAFVARLPKPRFTPGPREQLLVRELLLRLIEEQSWPGDPARLKTLIAPLVCSGPDSQQEFYALFEQWMAERTRAAEGARVRRIAAQVGSFRWLIASGVAAMAAVGILGSWLLWPLMQPLPSPPMPQAPAVFRETASKPAPTLKARRLDVEVIANGTPVKGATVWPPSPYQQKATDDNGRFAMDTLTSSPINLLVTHSDYQPTFAEGLTPGAKLFPIAMRPKVTKAFVQVQPRAGRRFPQWVSVAGAIVIGALLIAWRLWRLAKWGQVLRQWSAWADLKPLHVASGSSEQELFKGESVAELARELQRRSPQLTNRIAAEPTVRATIARGGILTPVREERQTAREYLAMVERSNSRDQQARLWTALLKRLASRNVFIDTYYFSGDPRLCDVPGHERAWVALDDVAPLHLHHELWLFADPSRLFDPFTGSPAPWTSALTRWNVRTVLTQTAPDGALHQMLERAGFRVAQPSVAGLLESAAGSIVAAEEPGDYPRLLEEDESRWLDAQQPAGADELRTLDRQLRAWLGSFGYRCLLACAVYPGMAWNLTLHLAIRLIPEDGREETLARLVRLVWFRHGRMPVWLREYLVEKLERPDMRRVLEVLEQFLKAPRRPSGPGDGLEFVRPEKESGVTHGPIRDYVFLAFLQGKKPSDVRAPGWLARLLYPEGRREYGLRRVIWIVAGGLLALGLYLGAERVATWRVRPQGGGWREVSQPSYYYLKFGFLDRLRPGRVPSEIRSEPPVLDPAFLRDRSLEIAMSRVGTPETQSTRPVALWTVTNAARIAGVTFTLNDVVPSVTVMEGQLWRLGSETGIVESLSGRSAVVIRELNGVVSRLLVPDTELKNAVYEPNVRPASRVNSKDGLTNRWIPASVFPVACSQGDPQCDKPLPPTIRDSAGAMVVVPAGPFRFEEHTLDQPASPIEKILPTFYIDKTEVTNEAYSEYAKAHRVTVPTGRADYPVVNVTAKEAQAFCEAAGKRLPTKFEWEKAARGSDDRRYPWGDQPEPRRANVSDNNSHSALPADSVLEGGASPYGALHMAGNVWEFVSDSRLPNRNEVRYWSNFGRLDQGKPWPLVFGGSWRRPLMSAALWDPAVIPPNEKQPDIGFRCVRSVGAP